MTTLAERLNGIRWRMRAMRRLWAPEAQPQMHFLPAIPIPDPTDGALDHPGAGAMFEDDIMGFGGWVAFDSGAPVARVEAWLDDTPIGRARVSVHRPDVTKLKDLPLARIAGFEMAADIGSLPAEVRSGAHELRVVATSGDGERFEFDTVPIMLRRRDWIRDAAPSPPPPPIRPVDSNGLRVLVFTHQLTLGGAQLYLLDLLREMKRSHLVELTVVSSTDGALRKELEALDIDVHLTSLAPFEKPGSHLGRIGELVSWIADGGFDVAFMNTATSGASFGGEVAESLGIPTVWAIHESFPPRLLWADLRPKVREYTEATLSRARFAIFEADATREIFEPLIGADRCETIPYGVDVEPIERARRNLDVARTRRRLDVPVDCELVVCIGTVEPRKAQVPLAQAFSLIAAKHPAARLVFVGAREEDPHTEDLEAVIEESDVQDRIAVIPVTPNVQDWYGIADLLVCASDVESLPRTVLEAMLWETPVLATDVFGIPDLIDNGVNGWLCASRDLGALANGLDRALATDPDQRRRIGAAARALVEDRHDLPHYADQVFEILQKAAENRPAMSS